MAFRALTRWYGKAFNAGTARRLKTNPDSRLHSNHMLVTVTGRRTGKRYEIPVNYRETAEGTLVMGTEASWWRNLEGGAPVEVLLRGEAFTAQANPILDDDAKRARYGRMLSGPTWAIFANSLVVIELERQP